MRISTKTLASLLLVTAVATAAAGISQLPGRKRRRESQFDRLLQCHDRKGELRAEVLGIDPLELRGLLKRMSFDEITKRRGFKSTRSFRIALFGKIKNELHARGWTNQRIERFVLARANRLS